MSKVRKPSRPLRDSKETSEEKFNLEKIIPQKYQVPLVIIVIILLYLIFLNPLYFGGKTFQSGDITASQSAKSYIEKDREGFSLWNPYIFCGMPAYALGTEFTWFNLIYTGTTVVRNGFTGLFANDYVKWTFYLMLLGITSFFFMRYLTKNLLVSLFTAIAISFSTGLIVFLFIGHVTKLTSLCMYPLIFLMLLRMQERIRLIDFLLLIVALQIFVQGFHVQIIFYTLFAVGIYFVYYLLRALIKKQNELRNNLLKSVGVFAVAAIIAILIQSDSLTQIYEYTPYSTRGTEGILEKSKGGVNESGSDYYAYHTDWSFSPGEVMTFVVPSWYGFGNSKYKGELTQGQEVEVNTYFGQMPFVDVAVGYMGIAVLFLAILGVFTRWKEPFVQFLTILTAIALIISFGKNFPVLFDLLFYHLPNFNKFRVPSMILVLVQLTVPVLAGLGLMKIISLRSEPDQKLIKIIKNVAFVFTGIFLLSLVLSGSVTDWFTGRVNEYAATIQATNPQLAQQHQALAPYSAGMFSTDLILAFLFLTITIWAAHLYIGRKISGDLLVIVIILITLIDLWRIDSRGAKYEDAAVDNNYFTEPDYIKVIKAQNNKEPFRILNIKQDRSIGSLAANSNYNAAFLTEDFYGYSGIKPRAFQDFMDVVGPANPTLWRMANVKYIIVQQPVDLPGYNMIQNSQSGVVYENTTALPRIYLVNRVEKKDALEFLNMVKASSFDPKDVAFVEDNEVSADKPDSTTSVSITNYLEDKLIANVNASGKNYLVFSSTYLPTGWKAFIDGNKTEIYRTNHDFMGIIVPQGKHKVEFRYAPNSFYIAKYTALILSSLVVAGLIFVVFVNRKKVQS